MADTINYGTHAPDATPAAAIDYGAHGQGDQLGFWDSLKAALPHPIDALMEWAGRGDERGKAMAALGVYNKIAAENPANKGLPPGKQKMLRDPTSEEQKIIDAGMTANLGGPEGNILSDAAGPAVTAGGQAAQGNLAGAAGTLAGGYVAPAAVAAAVPYVAPVARTAADFINKPGTGTILKGAAKAAGGAKVMLMGGPEGIVGGGAVVSSGVVDVVKGLGKRAEAAAKIQRAADQAAADAKTSAAAQGPNPYAAGAATAATNAPEALTATPGPGVTQAQPPYFAPTSTGPLPAPPVQAASAPVNPYASTNAPAALVSPAIAPEPVPAQPANPYFSGGGTAAPVPGPTTMPTPAPAANPVPLQPEGAAAVPPSTTTPYTSSGDALKAKYEGNAAAADEVKANWLLANRPGMTGADLKPGSEFKALVDKIPNPNAKSGKFTTRVNDPDHPLRVKAVADLLDAKLATQASVKNAAALSAKGITAKAAQSMTPEQLGVSDSKAAVDVRFQLQKLEAAAQKP